MRIAVISARKGADHKSPIMEEVASRLEARGASVATVYPEDLLVDLSTVRVEADLYVLKSGTETGLAYAALLHDAGARMVNSFPVTLKIRDKLLASKTLAESGVPAPASYVAATADRFAPLLERGPLVVKPIRGSRGRGVEVVREAAALDALEGGDGLFFAQSFHEPDGPDHKLYVVGEEVHGVRRKWPARTYEEKLGEPFEVPEEFREMAGRLARAFGTDLFGFDVVESGGERFVVDVNAFPGFKGVPDAARLLADYIGEAAAR